MIEFLNIKNSKLQITNNKWFDKLTTLSPVEGQYPSSRLQAPKNPPFLKGGPRGIYPYSIFDSLSSEICLPC
jgi:hypothetical protein